MPIPAGYTSGQIVQAVPTGINSAFVAIQPETALSAAATLTLDGCFTSSYTNYKLILNVTGAITTQSVLQLRASGVTATTNYNRQYIDAGSTTVSAGRATSQTSYEYGYIETDYRGTAIIEIFQPQLAQYTNFYSVNQYTGSVSTTNVLWHQTAGFHAANTAYDGFIITFNTNATGTYSLYGYGK